MNTSAPPAIDNASMSSMLSVKQQAMASVAAEQALKQLKNTQGDDVKGIVSAQISLLSSFYDLSLDQARRSFSWALVASGLGLVCFIIAIGFVLLMKDTTGTNAAILSAIAGAMIQFIGGVNFYLYGRTTNQLTLFQERLGNTQRFLLANSLCENLGGKLKDYSRARLIGTLAGFNEGDIDRAWLADEVKSTDASITSVPTDLPIPTILEPSAAAIPTADGPMAAHPMASVNPNPTP